MRNYQMEMMNSAAPCYIILDESEKHVVVWCQADGLNKAEQNQNAAG
jgi:hypothetical protein